MNEKKIILTAEGYYLEASMTAGIDYHHVVLCLVLVAYVLASSGWRLEAAAWAFCFLLLGLSS